MYSLYWISKAQEARCIHCIGVSRVQEARYCLGVSGKLQNAAGFKCNRCVNGQLFREVAAMKEIMISYPEKMECVDKSCYLGDLICADGEDESITSKSKLCLQSSGNWLYR